MIIRSQADVFRKLFIFTTVPFGLFMAIFFGATNGWEYGLVAGAACGLGYGIAMAAILGAINQYQAKKLGSNYSESLMGVHQVETLRLAGQFDGAFEACKAALNAVPKCKITSEDKQLGIITAQTGTTWKSFGETIMFTVSDSGDGANCNVTLSSKPAVRTTLVDYGKNMQNVRAIVAALGARAIVTTATPASGAATDGETMTLPQHENSNSNNAHS